jgi:hypothetical protein
MFRKREKSILESRRGGRELKEVAYQASFAMVRSLDFILSGIRGHHRGVLCTRMSASV